MLSDDDLQALFVRARDAGLLEHAARRRALMALPAIIRDGLPDASMPAAQLQSDLKILNDWPTLSGYPPLIMRWLAQAIATTAPDAREALRAMLIFEGYGDLASSIAVGAQRRLDAHPDLVPHRSGTLIIYARDDVHGARQLGTHLRMRLGQDAAEDAPRVDVSEVGCLQPGDRWAVRAKAALVEFETVLLCIGAHMPPSAHVDPMLSRTDCRLIPVLLPHADPTTLPAWVRDRTRFDLPEDSRHQGPWIDAIVELVDRPIAPRSGVDWARCNPYRGLRPFEPEQVERFFGRGADTARLIDRVRQGIDDECRLHTLLGASGSGASSLARAGLVPALRRHGLGDGRDWSVLFLRNADAPLQALATATLDVIGSDPAVSFEADMLDDPGELHAQVARRVGAERLLILVDQVEEILAQLHIARQTDDAAYIESCQAFFANLAHAARAPQGPVTVLLTVRADHLHRLLGLDVALNDVISCGQILLPAMRADALHVAIERPAQLAGRVFEPGVIAQLVADTRARPGKLPALQLALDRLWREAPGDLLDADTARRIGSLDGVIAQHAQVSEQTIARALPALDLAAHLPLLFAHLVRLDDAAPDTRRRAHRRALGPPLVLGEIADRLVECGLLTTTGHDRFVQVELAHESLLRDWASLRTWADAEDTRLRYAKEVARAAHAWHAAGQSTAALWHGARAQLLIDSQNEMPAIAAPVSTFRAAVQRAHVGRRRAWTAAGVTLLAIALTAMKFWG